MKKTSIRYLAAGVLFALLLAETARDLISLLPHIFDMLFYAPMSFLIYAGGPLIRLLPLTALMIGAFRRKIRPERKAPYTILYLVGELLYSAMSLADIFRYGYYLTLLYNAIHVGIFLLALYVLIPKNKVLEQAADEEKSAAADEEKLSFYRDLLRHGVITKSEFERMQEKIKQGMM